MLPSTATGKPVTVTPTRRAGRDEAVRRRADLDILEACGQHRRTSMLPVRGDDDILNANHKRREMLASLSAVWVSRANRPGFLSRRLRVR